jgi:hypothetical protein
MTDEQLGKLYDIYAYKTLTDALQEAYRLGMERAAEMQTAVLWEYSHESDDFQRGVIAMYDAIRAAKGE